MYEKIKKYAAQNKLFHTCPPGLAPDERTLASCQHARMTSVCKRLHLSECDDEGSQQVFDGLLTS